MPAVLPDAVDALLPQAQCARCGHGDCAAYAAAIANDGAPINRCPPGGDATIAALSALTGRPPAPLDPAFGAHAPPAVAVVDEARCIGCAICLRACPVDAIIGAQKRMHAILPSLCSGCELCVPACPVDCIAMIDVSSPLTGWAAWSAAQATRARARYAARTARLERMQAQSDARLSAVARARSGSEAGAAIATSDAPSDTRAIIEAALLRARQTRERAQ